MAITSISAAPGMSDAEWETRCNLAALYRVLDRLRMTDLIYTHMSARIPGESGTFLINCYGELFDEITASSLIKMDMSGEVIGGHARFNTAGFTIHSGVYRARPDANCVLHTHTRAGIAVATTRAGLRPISQDSLAVLHELGYHDYGTPSTEKECEALGRSCQNVNCVILRNHGLLTLGETIPAAFLRMYLLEHACQVQATASSFQEELVTIAEDVQADVAARAHRNRSAEDSGDLEWAAMLRMLEREGADYRR